MAIVDASVPNNHGAAGTRDLEYVGIMPHTELYIALWCIIK